MTSEATEAPDYIGTATYSPEDNKLRLYPFARLDAEIYARVKAAGFGWAPRQELFVAPMWTPQREDILLELCKEIGDEDKSLGDRAGERAERFGDYSEKRLADAESARRTADQVSERFAGGQPIIVNHHSEKRARKDAERMDNAMRRAVNLWATSNYWTMRAAAALDHAERKERPDVRARRIKGLEAEKRKTERAREHAEKTIRIWTDLESRSGFTRKDGGEVSFLDRALYVCGNTQHGCSSDDYSALRSGALTPEALREKIIEQNLRFLRDDGYSARWLQHFENRIAYERAMLGEAIGVEDVAERWPNIEPGGRVLVGTEWCSVIRVNRSAGRVASLTTNRRYVGKVGIEEVSDYRPPDATEAAAVKAATKLAPLCNFPSPGCLEMTSDEWKRRTRASDFWRIRPVAATATYVAHRRRFAPQPGKYWETDAVYLTDEKLKFPPASDEVAAVALADGTPETPSVTPPAVDPEKVMARAARSKASKERRAARKDVAAPFVAIRDAIRSGAVPKVEVVHATGFFPTPADLAARMVELAGIEPTMIVLEPSAGSGAILDALRPVARQGAEVVAVEINRRLADALEARHAADSVICGDFLEWTCAALGGPFDRVVTNPPFDDGADIHHIRRAVEMLRPGGRLVAICANGPRQRAMLRPLAEESGGTWEDLPEETFREAGTSVRAALLVIEARGDD